MPRQAKASVKSNYDVVIVSDAIMGSSTAWFLADNADFNGRILAI